MKKELEGFAAMASSCKGGRITIEEFARILKLPINPALEELFALFDRVRMTYVFFLPYNNYATCVSHKAEVFPA